MNISKENISVAIPTYNSSKYLDQLLNKILTKDIINEVIISDDNSKKIDQSTSKEIVYIYKKKYPKKNLELIKNKKRGGPFINKFIAINNCNNKFVYQIDSDNLPMINLGNYIKKELFPTFKEENIYYPSKIYQFRNNEMLSIPLSKFLTGTKYRVILKKNDFEFNKKLIKNSIYNNKQITYQKNRRWLINIGNFIVEKDNFLEAMKEGFSYPEEYLFAADQFLISYLWLKNKKNIEVRKKHYHFHRKRSDSISFEEKDRTGEAFNFVENKTLDLDE